MSKCQMSNVKCPKCQNCTFFHYTLYINKIRLGIASSFSVILRCQVTLEHTRKLHFFSFLLAFYFIKADLPSRVYNGRKILCTRNHTLLQDYNRYSLLCKQPKEDQSVHNQKGAVHIALYNTFSFCSVFKLVYWLRTPLVVTFLRFHEHEDDWYDWAKNPPS